MQQQENIIFKTIVLEVHKYFNQGLGTNDVLSIDDMIEKMRNMEIYISDQEVMSRPGEDYDNVLENIMISLDKQGIKISSENLKELFFDFWLDIAPTYIVK